jgi:hypothetical protein
VDKKDFQQISKKKSIKSLTFKLKTVMYSQMNTKNLTEEQFKILFG